jgi:UPF0288 family protein (methanogenesis marker protein 3)
MLSGFENNYHDKYDMTLKHCGELSYLICKQNMTSFRGQASWAKMTSPENHPTKKVNKAEELTYISKTPSIL